MSRATEEWIGKTPDTPIPPRVKLRVFERYEGKCHISGRKITVADKWDCDHVKALINGGQNRESNLAPALRDKHKQKTKQDVAEKAKSYAVKSKHLGIAKLKQKIPSRGFRQFPSNARDINEDMKI